MPRPQRLQRPALDRPSGFSLIELLVVVGIIVLLIGILIPALSAVRSAARKTQSQALMTQVVNAAQAFQGDKRRLPGYFPKSQMASSQNVDQRGFTENENVLLDLVGGLNGDQSEMEDPDEGLFNVGPSPVDGESVLVDIKTPLAGSTGYLKVDSDIVKQVVGQRAGTEEDRNWTKFPELVDSFGMPLLIFTENKSVNKADRDNYFFGVEDSTGTQLEAPSNSQTASFFWATNAGYLLSRGLGVENGPSVAQSRDEPLPELTHSTLGVVGGASMPTDIGLSLAGVLGNPGFPANRELNGFTEFAAPEAPRGAFNVISAGPDRVYFSSKQDPNRDGRVGYIKFDSSAFPPGPQPGTAEIDRFDDIVVSGG